VQHHAVEVGVDGPVGQARLPVVAVRHREVGVGAGLAGRQRHVPAAVRSAYDGLDAHPELDFVPQPEVVDVVPEVVVHQLVAREVGPLLGHREVLELEPGLGGVDVQRLVDRGAAVGVAEVPVAAHVVRQLELVVVDAVLLEPLRGGDPRAAGSDDADLDPGLGHSSSRQSKAVRT
jgi:hypothetical protein